MQTEFHSGFVLPLAYFGPVFYFRILTFPETIIDPRENYIKQSYRNRCRILGANGVMDLTVPVVGQKGQKTATADILIDNKKPWQIQHFRAMEAAYKRAPFYDHYIDILSPFFTQQFTTLGEVTTTTTRLVLQALQAGIEIAFSREYIQTEEEFDLRKKFKPADDIPPGLSLQTTYLQVFSYKFSFHPNLSVLDLLFNEGPNAIRLLRTPS